MAGLCETYVKIRNKSTNAYDYTVIGAFVYSDSVNAGK